MDALLHLNTALAGRYEIQRAIGKGGMATVYLARDVRHQRQVALKLLNPELGAVLGVERFLSEIRVTANLQHPNLLPLFDSGEIDGLLFYVMPFVEGESLRHRLDRERQLPVYEAVRIAVSVAGALDYAHRHGVIHRDLKPENILLHDGQPLVADFGIALAISNAGGARATQTGLSLGTPQYMSPEQATGDRAIDARTDIYSLGAVTYEMLAGEAPHAGRTAQAVIAKLMTEEPRPLTVLRRAAPAHIDAAVQRALEKLPADRFSSAREFAEALQRERAVFPNPAPAWRTRAPLMFAASAVGIAGIGAAFALVYAARIDRAPSSPITFKLDLPAGQQLSIGRGASLAMSPDGQTLVYAATGPQSPMLFARRLGDLQAKAIPGTENPADLKISRDDHWISFVGPKGISRVPSQGGSATVVREVITQGTSWGLDNSLVYASHDTLWRLDSLENAPRMITAADKAHGERTVTAPYVLPNGKDLMFGVLIADGVGPGAQRMGAVSIDGTHRVIFGKAPWGNVIGYVDGWLLCGRDNGTIEAARFDQRSRRFSGEPVTVLEDVMWKNEGGAEAALSATGTLAYIRREANVFLALVDRHGGTAVNTTEHGQYSDPVWSPDGKKIAVTVGIPEGAGSSIWIYDVASKAFSRLTSGITAMRPAWTADGKRVAFINYVRGASAVWWANADDSGSAKLFQRLPGEDILEIVFSGDGRYAVFRTNRNPARANKYDLFYVALAEKGESRAMPLLQTSFDEYMPSLSPDSRWIAYQSNETGKYEIYIRPFPGPGGRVQVSTAGGVEPRWSADGAHVVYREARAFRSATISPNGRSLSVTGRDSLFADTDERIDRPHQDYDIARDGRFVDVARRIRHRRRHCRHELVERGAGEVAPEVGPRRSVGAIARGRNIYLLLVPYGTETGVGVSE